MRNALIQKVSEKQFQRKCLEKEVRLHLDPYPIIPSTGPGANAWTPSLQAHRCGHLSIFPVENHNFPNCITNLVSSRKACHMYLFLQLLLSLVKSTAVPRKNKMESR